MHNRIFKQYIRDSKRNPVGLIMAKDSEHIAMSLCNATDKFNKQVATDIAIDRLGDDPTIEDSVNQVILKKLRKRSDSDHLMSQAFYLFYKIRMYFKD